MSYPKEKAEDLIKKMGYGFQHTIDDYTAKQCALVAVEEILKLQLNDGYDHEFWQEVKNEIEKR